jgi:nitroreductase
MDFFEVVARRRSIRSFAARPVEPEKLRGVLEAANAAPSAGNRQGYEIYVVSQPDQRRALARAALEQMFLAQAPAALVFCTNAERSASRYGERGRRLYAVQDATIAATFAMLAATALGLATVWIGAFRDEAVWQAIGSPAGHLPVAILPLGYPAEEPEAAPRRPLDELVHWR